jgi:AhpD family alkylhydroperoxidase
MKFKKRLYNSPKELLTDLWFPFKNRKVLKEIKIRGLLSPSFQERLILAVTAVNDCRYCSYFHTGQALKSGISPEEIEMLLSSTIDNCPDDEKLAVVYAQHWAETDAHPDPEAFKRLEEAYGVEKTAAIHLILRMIRTANLLGSSFDFILYRMSFGKWGR